MTHSRQFPHTPSRFSLRKTALMLALLCGLAMVESQPARTQTFTVLHVFTGQDGAYPYGGLTLGGAGTLYGTTQGGERGNEYGDVFKLAHKGTGWILTPLYYFTGGADGGGPESGLVVGPNGAFYSTTYGGGVLPFGMGTVFELRPPTTACKSALCYWNENVLYAFMGTPDVVKSCSEVYVQLPPEGVSLNTEPWLYAPS